MAFKLIALAAAAALAHDASAREGGTSPGPLKGFVYTSYSAGGYSNPASDASLSEVVATGVETIEVMATYYVANSVNATLIVADPRMTPTDEDILHAIATAKSLGLRIAFKPHIDCMDGIWRANIGTHFTTEEQWSDWFSNYTSFLLHFTSLAKQAGGVDFFNVGTELDGTHGREAQWRAVISAVRSALPDVPLWLGPNWGWQGVPGYQLVGFWDALDYLGVDMYAPLASHPDPTLEEAVAGWGPLIANLSSFYQQQGGKKGFIFAEIGYASYVDAAINAPGCCTGPPDPSTQAVLYESFFEAVWGQPWMAGVFWWAWPENDPKGTPCGTGFDIYRKPAAQVVKTAYAAKIDGVAGRGDAPSSLPLLPPASAAGVSASSSALLASSSAASPLIVYSNGQTSWQNWSYGNLSVTFTDATDPYPGHTNSARLVFVGDGNGKPSGGVFALHVPTSAPLNTSGFTSLQMDVRVTVANLSASLVAWFCGCDDCNACPSLPQQQLVDYTVSNAGSCALPTSWDANPAAARVVIPLADLGVAGPGASSPLVARIQVGAWSAVDFGFAFELDNLAFV